jgi:hypothetical protein
LSLVTLLALASTGSYASSFPSIEATSTTEDPLLPREPQDIPTDPILITSSVRGTHIKTSIAHSNPPVASSVVPPGVSSVVVPSHSIITSVQDPAKPSSVVLSSQSSYQMTSSHIEPSAPAPTPPSSATSSPWLSSAKLSSCIFPVGTCSLFISDLEQSTVFPRRFKRCSSISDCVFRPSKLCYTILWDLYSATFWNSYSNTFWNSC